MRKKRIKCPRCGVMMFPQSVQRHLQRSCKGNARGRNGEGHIEAIFTPEYIKKECLAIQKTWDQKEKERRFANDRMKRIRWLCPGTEKEQRDTGEEQREKKQARRKKK